MIIDKTNLAWIDLEMTGLNPNTDKIIEIGTLITNKDLIILSEGPIIAIKQNYNILKSMNKWNINIHTKSGLVNRVRMSLHNEKLAEKETLLFLKQWLTKNQSPICGNSISTDRNFLSKYMPTLEKFFHYRQIDVSTIKELVKRWQPNIYQQLKKKLYIPYYKI